MVLAKVFHMTLPRRYVLKNGSFRRNYGKNWVFFRCCLLVKFIVLAYGARVAPGRRSLFRRSLVGFSGGLRARLPRTAGWVGGKKKKVLSAVSRARHRGHLTI